MREERWGGEFKFVRNVKFIAPPVERLSFQTATACSRACLPLFKTSIRRDTPRVRKVKLAHWWNNIHRCNIINRTIRFPAKTICRCRLTRKGKTKKKKKKKKGSRYLHTRDISIRLSNFISRIFFFFFFFNVDIYIVAQTHS